MIVGLTVFVSLFILHEFSLFELAELKSLDHRFTRYADPSQASQDIVFVVIDEASLEAYQEQLGRWPWPRDVHGYIVNFLKAAGAKAIAFDIQFFEPDKGGGGLRR